MHKYLHWCNDITDHDCVRRQHSVQHLALNSLFASEHFAQWKFKRH